MSTHCVVVADTIRARFFTLDPSPEPRVEGGPSLNEHEDLVNPDEELGQRGNFTDSKTGAGRSPAGVVHGYDDNRDDHMDEYKRRFAQLVAARAVQFAQDSKCIYLVLVADPRMLGLLRGNLDIPPHAEFSVKEVGEEMTGYSAHELHAHLAQEGWLPPRRPPEATV